MGRPRKFDTLTTTVSGRVRPEQALWLRIEADRRFEGELSRTLRWALDQAQTFALILRESDPAKALEEMLHPEWFEPPDPEEEIAQAERELQEYQREQSIKRARRKKAAE